MFYEYSKISLGINFVDIFFCQLFLVLSWVSESSGFQFLVIQCCAWLPLSSCDLGLKVDRSLVDHFHKL